MKTFLLKQNKVFVKIAFVLLVIFGAVSWTNAAFNQQINYQGKLTDNLGATVADGTYNIAFNLYTTESGGAPIWSSTTTAPVTSGLFSYMLGSSTPLTGVDFNQTLYLGVNIGGIGAPSWDGEMSPRKILGAVPAAFESQNAQTLDNIATSSFLRGDIENSATALVSFLGGASTTELTAGTTTVTNFILNGETYTSVSGGASGLTNNAGVLTANISESNLNITGDPTNGYILTASSTAAGGFVWASSTSIGVHDAVTLTGSYDYLTITGQEITLAQIDLSTDVTGTLGDGSLSTNVSLLGQSIDLASEVIGTLDIASTSLTVSATGLTYNSATGDIDLTSGYAIPLSASTTEWNTFYQTPSDRITAGTGLTWSGNTIDLDNDFGASIDESELNIAAAPTDGYILAASSTASGGFAWYATSSPYLNLSSGGSSLTVGTDNYIPFSNSGSTDFDYSANFTFDGTDLAVNTDNLFVDGGTGYVGIGTVSPDSNIHIEDINTGSILRLTRKETDFSANVGEAIGTIEFEYSDSFAPGGGGIGAEIKALLQSGAGLTDLAFFTGSGGTTNEVMRVTDDGKVGIGLTSPSSKLTVAGNTYIGGNLRATGTIQFDSLTNGVLVTDTLGIVSASTSIGTNLIEDVFVRNTGDTMTGALTMSGTSSGLVLGDNYISGDSNSEGLYVATNGFVGVDSGADTFTGGAFQPAAALHVNAVRMADASTTVTNLSDFTLLLNCDIQGVTCNDASTIRSVGFAVKRNSNDTDRRDLFLSGEDFNILRAGASAPYASFDASTGNFGIGSTTPVRKLSVVGDAIITGALYDNNNSSGTAGYVLQSTGTGFTWVSTSTLALDALSLSYGTDNQIPFSNATSDDFDYSSDFTFDGSLLTLGGTGITLSGSTANIALGSNWLSGDGGDEGLYVNASGEVLVGTNTDAGSYAFQVNGVTYQTGSINFPNAGSDIRSGGSRVYLNSSSNIVSFYTNGIEIARFNGTSGHFGLGDVSPDARLEVSLNGGTTNAFYISSDDGNDGDLLSVLDTGELGLGDSTPDFGFELLATTTNGYFGITDTTDGDIFTVDLNGNVGIGTTSPATKLDVWGDFRVGTSSTPTLFADVSTGYVGINTDTPGTNLNIVPTAAGEGFEIMESDDENVAFGMYGYAGGGTFAAFADGNPEFFIDPTLKAYFTGGNFGIGTTTPEAILHIENTGLSGAVNAGIKQDIGLANSVLDAVQYGDRTYITNTGTATTTIVGGIIRLEDGTTLGNTVRGFEVQANKGGNTQGENTALSGFARTFGVRGYSSGDAGGVYEPAGGFFETGGTTQGNAIRGYSSSITTSELLSLYQEDSAFTGTGLLMNFGNDTGSFSSTSSKFVDLQNAGTSKFTVSAHGTTTIGDGTTNNAAGLAIGYGGLCVDDDGSCDPVIGRIAYTDSFSGNSDLAEMYFSQEDLEPGELVVSDGFISITKATGNNGQILGVVSTKPGVLLGSDDTPLTPGEGYPLALSGRVPVKLSTENGEIKVGDPLTLSSIPGIAMKATAGAEIVGYALEAYNGTYAYTEGFINQFGDDIAEPNYEAFNVNTKANETNPCHFGGGGAADTTEEECDPTILPEQSEDGGPTPEEIAAARYEAEQAAIEALRFEPATTYNLEGETVSVGTLIMFVDRGIYLTNNELDVLNELTSTSSDLVLDQTDDDETLWSRLKTLAQNFVDGVLTLAGVRADKVETSELCVDDVCVTADDLRVLLNSANNDVHDDNNSDGLNNENNTEESSDFGSNESENEIENGGGETATSTEETGGTNDTGTTTIESGNTADNGENQGENTATSSDNGEDEDSTSPESVENSTPPTASDQGTDSSQEENSEARDGRGGVSGESVETTSDGNSETDETTEESNASLVPEEEIHTPDPDPEPQPEAESITTE